MSTRLIEIATKEFLHYGFKNITVDEIARKAGVSKKTIYQEFENKGQLVLACVKDYNEKNWAIMEEITQRSKNAIEELIGVFLHMGAMFKNMNPVCMMDLERYYGDALAYMEEFKNSVLLDCVVVNIKRGIEEGLFREDIDAEIIAKYRVESVFLAMHNIFPKKDFDLVHVNKEIFKIYMYGVATPKGHKLITKYLNLIPKK